MSNKIIQPHQTALNFIDINGVNDIAGSTRNFHVKEFRIYEDICKPWFTGQLVIETRNHDYEKFLFPTATVQLRFSGPKTSGPFKTFSERFKVYSYDSKVKRNASGVTELEHTIQLIGEEFYRDVHNTVIENDKNLTGTTAAQAIHTKYIGKGTGMKILEQSKGLIGKDNYPYQVKNLKPVKAIHDILDRVIFNKYKTGAVVYFRDKRFEKTPSYSAGPLQGFLEESEIAQDFVHDQAAGRSLMLTLGGYNIATSMRPASPPGDTSSSVGDTSGLVNKSFVYDTFSSKHLDSDGAKALLDKFKSFKIGGIKGNDILKSGAEFVVSKYGGRVLFNYVNKNHQDLSVDKFATGRQDSEESLITALSYSPKYRVVVPIQSGLYMTCGKRFRIRTTIDGRQTIKTLFVPRLVHEVRFTYDEDRKPVAIQGTTELYGVQWE